MKHLLFILSLLSFSMNVFSETKKVQFSPSGKPIIQVFGNAIFDVDQQKYDYNFTRAHLGYQYQFSPQWSAKIIIDRGRPTTVNSIKVIDSNGNKMKVENNAKEGSYYTMFLKFASLKWKVTPKLTIEGGAVLQNHYITQEHFWRLRYVAQTFQDKYWKIPSSDLGFIAYYQLSPKLNLDLAFTNGEGPRKKQDKKGKIKVASGFSYNISNYLKFRAYYHNRQATDSKLTNEQMFSAFIGYQILNNLRIGTEINFIDNLNYINKQRSNGLSIFSIYQINKKTKCFIRFDYLNLDSSIQLSEEQIKEGTTIISGISHSPFKNVSFAFNYQGFLSNTSAKQNENRIHFSIEYKF